MIVECRFLSVREMARVKPSLGTVVISILDQSEAHERPRRLCQFRDWLELSFVDCSEGVGEGAWPDEMTPAQHRQACGAADERAPVLSDAQQIVQFVRKHHLAPDEVRLVVHCHAGKSRSAAVAQWVAVAHGVALPQLGDGVHELDRANPRVLRLLDRAAGRV